MIKDFASFDTETQNGKAFLVCIYNGSNYTSININNKSDAIQCLHTFFNISKTFFAYNLEYDVCSILKYLGYDAILGIYLNKNIICDNIIIRSVPNKFLIITKYYFNGKELLLNDMKKILNIKDNNASLDDCISQIESYNRNKKGNSRIKSKSIYAYDIWQYYQMSLDKAAQKHLNETKSNISEEWIKSMKDFYQDKRYKDIILDYCKHDAKLTYDLSKKFIKMLSDCNIHPGRFYSIAYMAKKYISKNIKITYINDQYDNGLGIDIIKFMSEVYRGGRTEIFKRGNFKNAYLSDMNSAYGLPLSKIKKIIHTEFSPKIDQKADYFFIKCKIKLEKDYINPIPIKYNNWKYPYGIIDCTIDNFTYDNAIKHGAKIIQTYKVLNIYCCDEYPFKDVINKLYNERKKSASHKYIFKSFIVSYIGKLHERKSYVRLLTDHEIPDILNNIQQYKNMKEDFESIIKLKCSTCYYNGNICDSCKNPECKYHKKTYKKIQEPPTIYYVGKDVFEIKKVLGYETNIIYAALITAWVRNIIFEHGKKLGKNLIGFLTDGIFSTKPLDKYSTKLGDFSLKYKGPLYVIGSGMYQTNEEVKFRGYHSDKIDLIQLAKLNGKKDTLNVLTTEKCGIGRAIKSISSFNDFNQIKSVNKKLELNFDKNRIWENQFKNFNESLESNIDSNPICN